MVSSLSGESVINGQILVCDLILSNKNDIKEIKRNKNIHSPHWELCISVGEYSILPFLVLVIPIDRHRQHVCKCGDLVFTGK